MGRTLMNRNLIIVIIIFFIFSIFVPVNLEYSTTKINNNLSNEAIISDHNEDEENNWNFQGRNLIKYDYTPIDELIFDGVNFTSQDSLKLNHDFSLNLNNANNLEDSFTIADNISNIYTPNSLQFNISSIKAITTETIYMEFTNKEDEVISNSVSDFIACAQQFEVSTTYAIFEGALMSIAIYNPENIGTNQLELFVVKESGGIPDLSDVRTYAVNSPYNSSNYSDFNGLFHYYDFNDITLEQGFYYVVANLSFIDPLPASDVIFSWKGDVGYHASDTYSRTHAGVWESSGVANNYDFSLGVRLIASDEFGNPLQYSDPSSILLLDNGSPITTLNQQILSTGLHNISASVPIEISFNNSYDYTTSHVIQSTVTVSNSTSGEYSNAWTLTWNTITITLPYSNLYRTQQITVPSNWNDVFSLLVNDVSNSNIQKSLNVFSLSLYDMVEPLDFKLTNYSPNFINSIDFPEGEDSFFLGHWTHNTTHATGYEGSAISVVVDITDSPISGGALNFTIFDTNGKIISLKNDLNPNLIYNDNFTYSKLADYEENRFRANTCFDPSVYGSDEEGFWTVMCSWQNGTEFGFFTKKITVLKPTLAEFFVEIDVSGIWQKISTTQITRINGETINLRVSYYSISDPFLSGIGTLIPTSNVFYTTEWDETDSFVFSTTNYTTAIIPNVAAGNYMINLFAECKFYQNFTSAFYVRILHQFNLHSVEDEYATFYTNDLIAKFYLEDISNVSMPVNPDDYWVSIEDSPIVENDGFVYSFIRNQILITVDTVELGFSIGTYELEVTVEKENFIETMGVNQTSTSVFFTINPIEIEIHIENSVTEINYNQQISLAFRIFDRNHSSYIDGATVEVNLDILGSEVELIENSEDEGLYSIKARIHEPTIKTLNIKVNITKTGFETIQNFIISTITIVDPQARITLGGIIASVIISVFSLSALVFFITRRKINMKKEGHSRQISQIRAIFQSTFLIRRVLIVHQETSLPIFELNLSQDSILDSSLVSGILQAISSIGEEMSGFVTGIKKIEYYGFTVTSALSGVYTVYIFSDAELSKEVDAGLYNLVNWLDITFGHQILQWDGSLDTFNTNKELIDEKIVEELFLWFLLPLEVESKTIEEFENLKRIDQEIVSLINSKGKATATSIIDQLTKYKKDETLARIFSMIKEEKLKADTVNAPMFKEPNLT